LANYWTAPKFIPEAQHSGRFPANCREFPPLTHMSFVSWRISQENWTIIVFFGSKWSWIRVPSVSLIRALLIFAYRKSRAFEVKIALN
jgi:hypothetical protein